MTHKRKTSYKDYNGVDIYEGDTLIHPDGTIGVVKCDESFVNFWRVVYEDKLSYWLGHQVGDKGQAVVFKDNENV